MTPCSPKSIPLPIIALALIFVIPSQDTCYGLPSMANTITASNPKISYSLKRFQLFSSNNQTINKSFILIQCSAKDTLKPFVGIALIDPTHPTENNKWPIIVVIIVIMMVFSVTIFSLVLCAVRKRQTYDEIPNNKSKVSSVQSSTSSRPQQKGSITEDIDRYHNRFIDSAISNESATEQTSNPEQFL